MKLEILVRQKERKAIKETVYYSLYYTSSQYYPPSSKNQMTEQSPVNIYAMLILGTPLDPSVRHCDLSVSYKVRNQNRIPCVKVNFHGITNSYSLFS